MADFAKRPLQTSFQQVGTKRALDQIDQLGMELPCSVSRVISSGIVEIDFEVTSPVLTLPKMIVPVAMARYVRLPIQKGDLGVALSGDVRLGGVTGLGSGLPPISQRAGNLGALVYVPLGNVDWDAVDLDAVVLTAPNGFVAQTDDKTVSITGSTAGLALKGNTGFFGTAPIAKPTVTGPLSAVTDGNAKAVLTSIIAALTELGLITNGTT